MSGMNPLPQTRQEMVALATRMWEGMKNDERSKQKEAKMSSSPRDNSTSSTYRGKKDRPHETIDQKGGGKTGKWPRGTSNKSSPKEFASGKNEKGERICYRCGSTKHLAHHHKKDGADTDEKKTSEPQKDIPAVKMIKASGRKKGHDRMAERAWELSDSECDSENE